MLTARALYANQVKQGNAQFEVLDWSSLIAGSRVSAGLEPFDSSKVCTVFPYVRIRCLTMSYFSNTPSLFRKTRVGTRAGYRRTTKDYRMCRAVYYLVYLWLDCTDIRLE